MASENDAPVPSWLSPEPTGTTSGGSIEEKNNRSIDGGVESPSAAGINSNSDSVTSGSGTAGTAVVTATGDNAAVDDEDNNEEELPSIIMVMRLWNIGAAIALIVCSILTIMQFPAVSGYVLASYAICRGIMILCLETQLSFLRVMVAVNFGFLFNAFFRFWFDLLIGSVAVSYNTLFGKIVAGVFAGVAIMNAAVLCAVPAYRRHRDRIAKKEDVRVEAAILKRRAAAAARRRRLID